MRRLLVPLYFAAILSACGGEPGENNPLDGLPVEAAKDKIEKAKDKIKAETKALEDAIKELDEAFEEVNK